MRSLGHAFLGLCCVLGLSAAIHREHSAMLASHAASMALIASSDELTAVASVMAVEAMTWRTIATLKAVDA